MRTGNGYPVVAETVPSNHRSPQRLSFPQGEAGGGGRTPAEAGRSFPLPCFYGQVGMSVCGTIATMWGCYSASSALVLFHVSAARYFLLGLFVHPNVWSGNFASTKFIWLWYLWYRTAYLGKLCWAVLGNCISFLFFSKPHPGRKTILNKVESKNITGNILCFLWIHIRDYIKVLEGVLGSL